MTTDVPDRLERDGAFVPRLTGPTRQALARAGYTRLDHFTDVTEADLRRIEGVGPRTTGRIRRALHAGGLAFAED